MSWPTVTVRISTPANSVSFTLDDNDDGKLDSDTLGDELALSWTDITDDVLHDPGIAIERGATRNEGPAFKYETGRCSFELDNDSGAYDPLNLSSPYVSAGVNKLGPNVPVTISATVDGVATTLFVGYVDSWQVLYPGVANTKSIVRVTAIDATGVLNAANSAAQLSQGDTDSALQRIERILDNIEWPAVARDIQSDGTETVLPTTLADSAWQELDQLAESCAGYLFVSRTGALSYRDKSKFSRTPDFTVGDGYLEAVSMQIAADWDQIYNCVRISNESLGEFSGTDDTSVARYGLRTYENTDSVLDTDIQLSAAVTHYLSQSKDLRLRVESVRVELKDDNTDSQWRQMLELEILDRFATTFQTTDGRTINQDVLVRGIDLNIQPFQFNWTVSTAAAPATVGNFTLDDSTFGVLANYAFWQQEVIAGYYADLVDIYGNEPFILPNADGIFGNGRDASITPFGGTTYYPFRLYLTRVENRPVSDYLLFEDWAPQTFAEWQASIGAFAVTVENAPTLALF